MAKKILWIALASLVIVVFVAVVISYTDRSKQAFHGSVIDPPMPAPDFTLTSQASEKVSLSDLRGKYILLFFGYTNCPDECPATMGVLKQVYSQLKDQADKIQVVFVTTDPAHDTPQALGEFLNRFDPSFIGLTGTKAELQPIWANYGVTVLDEGTTHSLRIYLIDPQGNITLTYPTASVSEDITADLNRLFTEN
jgi:protein SCO1/2